MAITKVVAILVVLGFLTVTCASAQTLDSMSDEEWQAFISGMSEEEFQLYLDLMNESQDRPESWVLPNATLLLELDQKGNAEFKLEDPIYLDYGEANIAITPSGTSLIIQGSAKDYEGFVMPPDITFELTSDKTSGRLNFESRGAQVGVMLEELRPFKFEISLRNEGNNLAVSVTGNAGKALLNAVGLNISPGDPDKLRNDLQSQLDIIQSWMRTPQPRFTVDEFSVAEIPNSDGQELNVVLRLTIGNWDALYSAMIARSMSGDDRQADVLSCMGITQDALLGDALRPGNTQIRVNGFDEKITVALSSVASRPSISRLPSRIYVRVEKTNGTSTISGELEVAEPERFVGCILKSALGGYEARDIAISVVKTPENAYGKIIVTGKANGLARKTKDGWEIGLSGELTSQRAVMIVLPADMEVLSSSGVTGTDGKFRSISGEAIYMLYGKKGGIEITNVWSISVFVVIVLLVLLLLLRRRRK